LPTAPSAPYQDRKTGLTVFGILTLLFGVLCALVVPLMLLATTFARHAGAPEQEPRAVFSGAAMYAVLAAVLISLGVGSIKARRWARALLLILAWSWLLVGVFTTAFMIFVMPKLVQNMQALAPAGQSGPPAAIFTVMIGFMAVLMVILPALWFYGSRHVKATCEAEDPVERWTDRSPLPVIAVSVWLIYGVPWMLFMAVAYKGVFPFFGNYLVGPGASAIYVLLAVLWGYSAWALYKLRPSGWWIFTVTLVLFSISGYLTYSRHDLIELYRLMEYPAAQLAQLEKFTFLSGPGMAWLTAGMGLAMLGYMLFVRRYFRAPGNLTTT
jgi:MFS family permease